jgi:hypothetical protein
MVQLAEFLAQAFWPALLLGLAMAVAWRFVPPGKLRTNLQIIASLLVFVPQLIIIFLLYQSIALLLYQEALLSLWMLGAASLLAAQLWKQWSRRPASPSTHQGLSHWRKTEEEIAMEATVYQRIRARPQQRNPAALVLAIVVTGGFGLYLARTFVADAFYPRVAVNGRVDGLRFNRGSRAPRLSDIVINGGTFHATRDLHSRLQRGDYIRAEVGAGSGAVLRWDYIVPPGRN